MPLSAFPQNMIENATLLWFSTLSGYLVPLRIMACFFPGSSALAVFPFECADENVLFVETK